jgi:hypothetical protein
MKKKIILGLLVLGVLLCFIAQSWALDWKRAQQQYYEHPEQDMERVPVIPQTAGPYPPMIKFIFVPTGQNLPVLIFIDKSSVQAEPKVENSTKKPTNSVNKTR